MKYLEESIHLEYYQLDLLNVLKKLYIFLLDTSK